MVGYTVRVAITGYSYGGTRAAQEAEILYRELAALGIRPVIRLYLVDPVESRNHPKLPSGQPLDTVPDNMHGIRVYH